MSKKVSCALNGVGAMVGVCGALVTPSIGWTILLSMVGGWNLGLLLYHASRPE